MKIDNFRIKTKKKKMTEIRMSLKVKTSSKVKITLNKEEDIKNENYLRN